MGKFLVVNQRVNIFGNPVQQWAMESSGNTIAGTWTDNSTNITFASVLTQCTTSNQVIYTHYIYNRPERREASVCDPEPRISHKSVLPVP